MFDLLLEYFGPQHWWPGDTDLEILIGAVLTQNTNWNNVEKAIYNLKTANLISLCELHSIPISALADMIRPAGYYNVKAKRLKNLINFIADKYKLDISLLQEEDTMTIRKGLLSVNGIGPETADSILLYVVNRPVFVIDAYTHRIMSRHGMIADQVTYQELQDLFQDNLSEDTALYNEFHALMVKTGKEYCKKRPYCEECPLQRWGPLRPHEDS
jgi:endonuclease-3 related protein